MNKVREERWVEVDAPIADEPIIRSPKITDLEGPSAIELRPEQSVEVVQTLVSATGKRCLRVVHPRSVVGRWAEAIGIALALLVRCKIIVHGLPEEGRATSLLMHCHRLTGRTDDIDDQITDE